MSLRLYNTLTRGKEEFVPRDTGRVGIYVCGPTVYNFIHVGNARTYLSFDTVVRYLRFVGLEVTYARNLTDVDDKIINRANEEGTSAAEVAEKYSRAFREDMARLRTLPPDVEPKATEHIPEMVDLTERLIDRGVAYEVEGDVYFEIEKFPSYGKLSGRGLDDMRAGERVDVDPRKKNPLDFALWKAAKPGEPSWPSPWGEGRPGWHLECSVMSEKYLGQSFDIHGGAQDLIFPHHENEIAQAEAAGVEPFVRYWMHAGMLNFSGEKMAKSVGNIVLMRDLLDRHDANVVRMLMLSTHYRSPLEFSEDRLGEATEKLGRLRDVMKDADDALFDARAAGSALDTEAGAGSEGSAAVEAARAAFTEAMDDDFNAPLALAAVFELVQQINGALKAKSWGAGALEEARAAVVELSGVLGLDLGPDALPLGALVASDVEVDDKAIAALADPGDPVKELASLAAAHLEGSRRARLAGDRLAAASALDEAAGDIGNLIALRARARADRDWATADRIRDELAQVGVVLEDKPSGTRWVPSL